MSVPKYISQPTLDLFTGNVCSTSAGGFERAVSSIPGAYTDVDTTALGNTFRQNYLLSNNGNILDRQISFTSDNSVIPNTLINTTLRELYAGGNYLIIVNASIKIDNACFDPLTDPPKAKISVSNQMMVPDQAVDSDFWAVKVFDDNGLPRCNGCSLAGVYPFCTAGWTNWSGTALNLSDFNNNFGSSNGTTIDVLEQIKSIGFSFYSANTAARGCITASIDYSITMYPKNPNGTNPVVSNPVNTTPTNTGGNNNATSSTNWWLILGLGGGGLLLLIIIIIIVVVVTRK